MAQAMREAEDEPVCNAYNLRHRNEAILDIARAMQLRWPTCRSSRRGTDRHEIQCLDSRT